MKTATEHLKDHFKSTGYLKPTDPSFDFIEAIQADALRSQELYVKVSLQIDKDKISLLKTRVKDLNRAIEKKSRALKLAKAENQILLAALSDKQNSNHESQQGA
jgi:hypothetical protein